MTQEIPTRQMAIDALRGALKIAKPKQKAAIVGQLHRLVAMSDETFSRLAVRTNDALGAQVAQNAVNSMRRLAAK